MTGKTDKKAVTGKLEGAGAAASSTGGITLLLNFAIPLYFNMTPEEAQNVMTVTPIAGGLFAWAISNAFKAWGRDPQLINNERVINRKIKQLKKDLNDPHLTEAAKSKLVPEYERLAKLRRHPELLGSKTSNQG